MVNLKENLSKIIAKLSASNKTISTMESCTGGALASLITDVSGASAVFKYGAVLILMSIRLRWVFLVR
jgi:nicotinamide mononucleotide (NMN) deamidase PncC